MGKRVGGVQACEVVSACFEEAAQRAGVGGAPNLAVHKVQSPLFNNIPDALLFIVYFTRRRRSECPHRSSRKYKVSHRLSV